MGQYISSIISAVATILAATINSVFPRLLKKDSKPAEQNLGTNEEVVLRRKYVNSIMYLLGSALALEAIFDFFFNWSLLDIPIWMKILLVIGFYRIPFFIERASHK